MTIAARKPLDRAELIRLLREALPGLRARFGIVSLSLFGSYARGEATDRSDVDLLAEFDRVPSLLKLIGAEHYVEDMVGIEVDLVQMTDLRPAVARHALAEAIRI